MWLFDTEQGQWSEALRNRALTDLSKLRELEAERAAVGERLDFHKSKAGYLAIGTGDTELSIFAGMRAAVVISLRVFLFRGAGKAN